jgi:hypothetical protein
MKFLTMLMLLSLGCADAAPEQRPPKFSEIKFSEILLETLQRDHKRELTFNEVSARATAAALSSIAETMVKLDRTLNYLVLLCFVLTGSTVLCVVSLPTDRDVRGIGRAVEAAARLVAKK